MPTLDEFRSDVPKYKGLSDEATFKLLLDEYFPGVPKAQVAKAFNYVPEDAGAASAAKNVGGGILSGVGQEAKDVGFNAVGGAIKRTGDKIQADNPHYVTDAAGIADNPLLFLRESVGSMGGQLAASAAVGLPARLAGAALGASAAGAEAAGTVAANLPIQAQSYGGNRAEQAQKGIDDPGRALLASLGSVGVEHIGGFKPNVNPLAGVKNELAGKTLGESAKQIGLAAGKSGLAEGVEEIPDQFISDIGGGTPVDKVLTKDNARQAAFGALSAFPGGALLGGGRAVAGGMFHTPETKPLPDIAPIAEASTVDEAIAGAQSVVNTPAAAQTPPERRTQPRQQSYNAPDGIRSVIGKAASKHGVSAETMMKIADIESKFDPSAHNASGAAGLFQFMPGTAKQYGLANPFDASANADAAARLLKDNTAYLFHKLGRSPSDGELYLAHQQGAGGAVNLLRDPNRLASDVVGKQAILQNGGNLDMTAGEFANLWINKVDAAKGVERTAEPYVTPELSATANQALAENPPTTAPIAETGLFKTPETTADATEQKDGLQAADDNAAGNTGTLQQATGQGETAVPPTKTPVVDAVQPGLQPTIDAEAIAASGAQGQLAGTNRTNPAIPAQKAVNETDQSATATTPGDGVGSDKPRTGREKPVPGDTGAGVGGNDGGGLADSDRATAGTDRGLPPAQLELPLGDQGEPREPRLENRDADIKAAYGQWRADNPRLLRPGLENTRKRARLDIAEQYDAKLPLADYEKLHGQGAGKKHAELRQKYGVKPSPLPGTDVPSAEQVDAKAHELPRFELGRKISSHIGQSSLRPSQVELNDAAKQFGVTKAEARRALDVFNSPEGGASALAREKVSVSSPSEQNGKPANLDANTGFNAQETSSKKPINEINVKQEVGNGKAATPEVNQDIVKNDNKTELLQSTGDNLDANPDIVEYTTKRGRVLRGVVRKDLSEAEAKAIDEYAFEKDGGWFIREKHLDAKPDVATKESAPEKPDKTDETHLNDLPVIVKSPHGNEVSTVGDELAYVRGKMASLKKFIECVNG